MRFFFFFGSRGNLIQGENDQVKKKIKENGWIELYILIYFNKLLCMYIMIVCPP